MSAVSEMVELILNGNFFFDARMLQVLWTLWAAAQDIVSAV